MSALGSLVVKLALEHAEYTQGLDKSDQAALKFARNAQRNFDEASASVKDFMKGAVAQAAAAVGALVAVNESFTRSLEFSKSIAQISTQIDGSIDDLNRLEAAAKSMSVQFGTLPVDQSRAFYEIISAGTSDVAKATELLSAANKLAIGGNTDLATSVDGLTNIMNSYSGKVESADAVSDALFVGMKAGKATMEELSSSLGKVTPIASSLNVSFDELVATVSALSKQGISTNESVTGVRAILASVAKPTKEAKDLAAGLGLEFNAAGLQAKGFAGFLDEVSKKTGGSVDKLALLFGGVEALIPIMALSGQAGTDFTQIMQDMGNKAGSTQDAFDKMAASPGFKIDQLMASINNIAITLGDSLASVLAPAAEKASKAINDLFGIEKNLSAIDKQKQKITELQEELDSLNNVKHIPFFIGDALFDKRQADLLEQRIEDGIADLHKLEEAAIEAGKTLINAPLDNPGGEGSNGGAGGKGGGNKPSKKPEITDSERFVQALMKESEELGKNRFEILRVQAAKFGLSDAYGSVIDKMEQESEAAKFLEGKLARVKNITEQNMTADERFSQTIQELNDLMAMPDSGLSVETYQRAVQSAQNELEKSMNATKQAGVQAANEWDNIWRTSENTARMAFTAFAAHGTSAMDSIGQSIKTAIIDVLYQLTVRKWVINVGAAIGLDGGMGGTGSASGFGVTDLLSAGSNLLSAGNSGLKSLIGRGASALGFSSFGAGASGAASAGVFGAGGRAFLGGAGTAIGGTAATEFGAAATMGSAMGAAAGPLLAAAVATSVLRSLAGDKRMGGGFGKAINAVGDIPIIGDFLPFVPLMNSLFGRGPYKFRQQVAIGEASAEGFDGRVTDVFRSKGGLFLKNKHKEQSAENEDELLDLFGSTIKGYADASRGFAENLGLDTDVINNYSKTIRLESEKGKTLTEEAIRDMLAGIGNEMAQGLLPSVDALKKSGEDSMATLSRLNNEFVSLTQGAQNLGASVAYAKEIINGMSFESRTAFVDAAGGIDSLNAKTQFFADNFLTAEERLAPAQESLNNQLAALGLSTELTRDQFKQLVQTSGPDMINSLLGLEAAFITVRNAQDQLIEAARSLVLSNVGGAFGALQKSVDAERNRITEDYNAAVKLSDERIQDVTQSIDKLETLSGALKSTVDSIRPIDRDQAKKQIQDAINIASTGGGLPDVADISQALDVLKANNITGVRSSFEFAREQAKTANLIGDLGDLTDSQVTLEERSLRALEAQRDRLDQGFEDEMGRLDSLIEQGQREIDTLNGLDTTLLSLATAIGQFNLRVAQGGGAGIVDPLIGGDPVIGGNKAIKDQQIIDYFKVPRTPEEIARDAIANGVTSQQIIGTGLFTRADADKFFRDNPNIPKFAKGTAYVPMTGPAIVHQGERIITAEQNRDLRKATGSDEIVKELRLLRAAVDKSEGSNRKVSKILKGVTQGGTALRMKSATS